MPLPSQTALLIPLRADLAGALTKHGLDLHARLAPTTGSYKSWKPQATIRLRVVAMSERRRAVAPPSTRPNAVASTGVLIDIMLLIFDEVQNFSPRDRAATLCSAALVCRQWCDMAQPLLWRSPPPLLSFESQAHFMHAIETSSGRLGRLVRSLTLMWYPMHLHGQLLQCIAKHCSNVSALALQRAPVADVDTVSFLDLEILSALLPAFPKLAHLDVHHYDGSSGTTSPLALPSLHTIPVPGLETLRLSGLPHIQLGVGAHLRALHISSWTRLAGGRVEALARVCPNLRRLRLQWHVADADVHAFIAHCPRLEVLDIVQLRDARAPSSSAAWLRPAAERLDDLRCVRTNAAVGADAVRALARGTGPLETLAFNRLEIGDEQDLVALVRAHRRSLKHVTLINWDALTVTGLPAGDALLRELSMCSRLECLEVDFSDSPAAAGALSFVDGRAVRPASIELLFGRCPQLVRTPELVALAKVHPRYDELLSARLAAMTDWEHDETSECGDRVVGW